ncbi:MAG: nitrite reductase small subunit NirD [Candidatus Omnitrophica bacterium]|nr:nitrite reductase small subunit NirD [Candidatus Omnitrophota bacterium]
MPDYIKVCSIKELPEGQCKTVKCGETEVAVFHVKGQYYAIGNTCPHMGGPLCEGEVEDQEVVCPWHGWSFDLESGVSPVNPNASVPVFKVKIEGEDVLVSGTGA